MVFTKQPKGGKEQSDEEVRWMRRPQAGKDCPEGLEFLQDLDLLVVKQKVHYGEGKIRLEENNEYDIYNKDGEKVYTAIETTDRVQRVCCSSQRGYTIRVLDEKGKEVMRIKRPFLWLGGYYCIDYCAKYAYESFSEAPVGKPIGSVRQQKGCCLTQVVVRDPKGDDKYLISEKATEMAFEIVDINMKPVGHIRKKWAGIVQEFLSDADNFSVTFPREMDVNMKAMMIGATFLVDFMAYEDNSL